MNADNRKQRRSGSAAFAVAAVFSVVVHGVAMATLGFNRTPHSLASVTSDVSGKTANPTARCYRDSLMRALARSTACATPFVVDRSVCLRDGVLDSFEIDLLLCDGDKTQLDAAQVALVNQEELQRLKPRPLLELSESEEQRGIDLIEDEVAEKVEEAKKEREKIDRAAQVVEIAKPVVEATPDQARFVSEFDSQVEVETVARGSTEEMVARPAPKELPVAAKEQETPSLESSGADNDGTGDSTASKGPSLLAMRGPNEGPGRSIPGQPGSRDGVESDDDTGGLTPFKGTGSGGQAGGEDGEGDENPEPSGARPGVPNLRPTQEMLERSVGGGSVDNLDGVGSGDFTALNTKEWLHAPFFNRMKRRVARNWHPDRAYLRRDPTGKVFGPRDRVTVLQVSLKPGGSLAGVVIAKQSGVALLDNEAVSAFRRAQPFPNPPGNLVGSNGLIRFTFGFHFQVGSSSERWRIFRKFD